MRALQGDAILLRKQSKMHVAVSVVNVHQADASTVNAVPDETWKNYGTIVGKSKHAPIRAATRLRHKRQRRMQGSGG